MFQRLQIWGWTIYMTYSLSNKSGNSVCLADFKVKSTKLVFICQYMLILSLEKGAFFYTRTWQYELFAFEFMNITGNCLRKSIIYYII